jgi:hypothetical protein
MAEIRAPPRFFRLAAQRALYAAHFLIRIEGQLAPVGLGFEQFPQRVLKKRQGVVLAHGIAQDGLIQAASLIVALEPQARQTRRFHDDALHGVEFRRGQIAVTIALFQTQERIGSLSLRIKIGAQRGQNPNLSGARQCFDRAKEAFTQIVG